MDEPLAALDVGIKQEIMPYLDRLHEEIDIPVVYVSIKTSLGDVYTNADTKPQFEQMRLNIDACDVIIATSPLPETTCRNQFSAVIHEIVIEEQMPVKLVVLCGETVLKFTVSFSIFSMMQIKENQAVTILLGRVQLIT